MVLINPAIFAAASARVLSIPASNPSIIWIPISMNTVDGDAMPRMFFTHCGNRFATPWATARKYVFARSEIASASEVIRFTPISHKSLGRVSNVFLMVVMISCVFSETFPSVCLTAVNMSSKAFSIPARSSSHCGKFVSSRSLIVLVIMSQMPPMILPTISNSPLKTFSTPARNVSAAALPVSIAPEKSPCTNFTIIVIAAPTLPLNISTSPVNTSTSPPIISPA